MKLSELKETLEFLSEALCDEMNDENSRVSPKLASDAWDIIFTLIEAVNSQMAMSEVVQND